MAPLRDQIGKKKAPPNLRRGNARYRCGLCANMGRGECLKYGIAVRPTELCDSFTAKKEQKS